MNHRSRLEAMKALLRSLGFEPTAENLKKPVSQLHEEAKRKVKPGRAHGSI